MGIESPDRGPSQSGANGERQSKLSASKNLSILTSLLINEINIRIVKIKYPMPKPNAAFRNSMNQVDIKCLCRNPMLHVKNEQQ